VERRLAHVLVDAGSIATSPPPRPMWGSAHLTVSSDPIRVETPWERRGDAFAALRALVDPAPPPSCMHLERVARRGHRGWTLLLAPMNAARDGSPEWAIGSWHDTDVWGRKLSTPGVIGMQCGDGSDGTRRVDLVDTWGNSSAWTEDGAQHDAPRAPGPRPLGRGCVALQDGQWWVVDAVAGTLWIPGDRATELHLGAVGITQMGDHLLVATADQKVHVLDAAKREIVRSFPATIVPASRFDFGECATLAAGRDWVASLDSLRGILHVYDASGAPLGRVSLPQAVGTSAGALHTIRGAGEYLGVGHDLEVTTLRVVRDAACPAARPDDR